jgi:hypothetical protein
MIKTPIHVVLIKSAGQIVDLPSLLPIVSEICAEHANHKQPDESRQV